MEDRYYNEQANDFRNSGVMMSNNEKRLRASQPYTFVPMNGAPSVRGKLIN